MAATYFTQEEREAYRDKVRREAEQRIETLAKSWQDDPKQLAEYLQFASRFHRYSPRNQMLVYSQNPAASFVASFKDFKEMGYFIRKGEHGMQILAPAPVTFWRKTAVHPWRRLTDATDDEKFQVKIGMYESREQMFYKVGTVFDITQTTCPIEDYPKLLGLGYNDEQHAAIYRALCDYSGTLGMPVTEKPLEIGLRGAFYHSDHHIEINSVLGDTQKLSTLLHEMSHGVMGHDTAPDFSVALKELEADALSIMLEDRFGIEITDARQRHLAGHFKAYMDELSEKGLEFDPAQTFKRVHDRYEKCEAAMARHLEECGILPTQSPVSLTADIPYPPATLQEDHFYVDLNAKKIEWLYYNPDGDHFVATMLYAPDFEDAIQVAAEGGGTPWDVLETQGQQYIYDRGTEEYTYAWQKMLSEKPYVLERTQESFGQLNSLFDAARDIDVFHHTHNGVDRLDYGNLFHVRIIDTTIEDPVTGEDLPLQVNLDLINNRVERALCTEVFDTRQYDSLYSLTRDGIASEQDLTAVSDGEIARVTGREPVGNTYTIYQLRNDPSTRELLFEAREDIEARGLKVDPQNYEAVYSDTLYEGETLEDLYRRFNIDHPADYTGRSMSMSDVVVLHQNGVDTAHYCDRYGFSEVPEFLQQEQQPERVERLVGASLDPERITGEEFDERWEQGQREFRNVEFYEINMPARMNGTFEDCSFLKCDFTVSEVSATFKNCAVYEPKTTAAIFKGAEFDGCKIGYTSFRDMVLEDVMFRNTDFQKCNAMRTRFSNVQFDGGSMDRFHFYNGVEAERVSGLDSVKIGISGETEKMSKKHAEKIRNVLTPSYAFPTKELDAYAAEQKPVVSSEEYTCAVRWMAEPNRDQLDDTVPAFVAGNPPAEDTYKLAAAIARANDPDLPPELQQAEASGVTYTLLKRHGIPVASPTFNGGKLDLQTQRKLLQRIRSGTGYLQIQVNGTIQPSQAQLQNPTSQAQSVTQAPSTTQPIAPPMDPAE